VAHLFGGYWWAILPGAALAVLALSRAYHTPGPRLWIDRKLLRAPLLGPLLRDVAVARFTRTLGTLTSAGIPILQALRITKGTLGNRAMEGVIDEVCEQVAAGRTIAEPMDRSGYFPPMLVQIVNLGERSGRLDEMLTQAADAFEDKTESSVKLFTTALPPILVVVLACCVGFVVLSIMLPLLQFQESLK
jgi:type II secretory pathway component PulF